MNESCGVFTFDFEVVSSKTIGLEVEGQRCVGLIQEQVDPRQLNAVPLKHRCQNLSGNTHINEKLLITPHALAARACAAARPPLLPQRFLFHRRYDFCVYVHVEIKLKAEALLAGVLQGEQTHCQFTQVGLQLGEPTPG